jgi:Rrf2 family protein
MTQELEIVAGDGQRPRRRRPSDPVFHVSAKIDYAVRATTHLAGADRSRLVKSDEIARAENIPLPFLLNILTELRHARLVRSHRGSDGGYQLARNPAEITVGDVVRSIGAGPNGFDHDTNPGSLAVWTDAREAVNSVLEAVTLEDMASMRVPVPAPPTA